MASIFLATRACGAISSIPNLNKSGVPKRSLFGAQWPTPRRAFSVSAASRVKKYTEDHEWVELASDGNIITLGISKYAAQALGDVIYVELPEAGREVGLGDSIGAVESVKSASDIMTPISGKVVETNSVLEETPGLLNKDPEGEGWIAKMEVKEAKSAMGKLMDSEGYRKFTEESS